MRQQIAVVGAGVSGLVAAYLLSPTHEVTVFEANDYLGGHSNTVRVDTADDTVWVDTGFIMFNDRNYPNFERLLRTLSVSWQPCPNSFSVSDPAGDMEYSSGTVNGLFAQRTHLISPRFYRMLADLVRFQREAPLAATDTAVPLGDWLQRQRFSSTFIDQLLTPVLAAIWSAAPNEVPRLPLPFVVEFLAVHGLLRLRDRPKWRSVTGGSRRYVEALTARLPARLWLKTPVASIARHADHVSVTLKGGDARRFDQVVLATHADQALGLLTDADRLERQVLSSIPFRKNEVVLHTDHRLLPHRRRAWASWNYHLSDAADTPTLTYHLNRLQALRCDRQFCVTLNNGDGIDPDRVLRRLSYAHPVYTPEACAARRLWPQISGTNRTHFCGAYWGWGFHEDGVVFALRVAGALGCQGL